MLRVYSGNANGREVVYNVLDRNLAVQAKRGKRLPKQVLSFDPNDGAGFWWANGRNTFVRNVACENDQYGFRFELAQIVGNHLGMQNFALDQIK